MWMVRWYTNTWQATLDGGRTWHGIEADTKENAILVAAEKFGIALNNWKLKTGD